MAIIWITHDLGVIAGLADRVMIMYAGQVVESGPVRQIFRNASHPYTRALLRTLPDPAMQRGGRLRAIAGQPPLLCAPPRSCPFAPRCSEVHDRCLSAVPVLSSVGNDHLAACWQVAAAEVEPVHA